MAVGGVVGWMMYGRVISTNLPQPQFGHTHTRGHIDLESAKGFLDFSPLTLYLFLVLINTVVKSPTHGTMSIKGMLDFPLPLSVTCNSWREYIVTLWLHVIGFSPMCFMTWQ